MKSYCLTENGTIELPGEKIIDKVYLFSLEPIPKTIEEKSKDIKKDLLEVAQKDLSSLNENQLRMTLSAIINRIELKNDILYHQGTEALYVKEGDLLGVGYLIELGQDNYFPKNSIVVKFQQ